MVGPDPRGWRYLYRVAVGNWTAAWAALSARQTDRVPGRTDCRRAAYRAVIHHFVASATSGQLAQEGGASPYGECGRLILILF
jgi:hypothetical protein